jgi:hypothetical protein
MRIERNFQERHVSSQDAVIGEFPCRNPNCRKMVPLDVVEYEEDGVIYFEAKCARCGVRTRLREDEFPP